RLNLEAGKKAKDSTAYTAALVQYFTPGIEVLLPDSWKTHYDLTFALYREKSECEYLCRNFEKAEESFDLILDRAKSKFDRAEIHNIRMVLYENSGNYIKAISIGIKALKSFGLSWQLNKKSEILSLIDEELLLYRANLERINIADLINAPEVVNPEIRVCIRLLMNMMGSAFFSDQDLLAAIALKIVNLAIEYGNSQETCYGYAVWGMLAGHILIDDETGYGFGQLAMNLTEQFNNLNLVCKVFNVFGGHISPWRSHLKKSIPILRKGYLAGVETGEVTVSYNSYNLIIQRILVADSFGNIIEESNKHIDFLKQIKSHIFVQVQQLYQHFLFNLQGLTADKFSLSDDEFDEFQCLRIWQENNFLTGVAPYNIFKTQIFFLYGDYEKALERAIQTEESIVFIAGMPIQTEYYFYYSLVLTAIYTTATAWEQQEYREILEANQQKMKIWADNCPENFLHKYLLMEAEIARISGKEIEVIWDLYDRAISSAHENEFIQNEALANELAAKFWLAKGKEEIAQLYMKKAHYGYQLWGAKRKVEDLEEKYQQLLPKSSAVSRAISIEKTITTTDSQSGETLDLATFIKATQAISSEIMLDKLLAALMKILIQNAGAQIGYLILQNEGKLQIEASGEVDSDNIAILESISIQNRLPEAIINYVVRTKETVVLNDATREGNFINDPYIKQHQAKSILCAPLLDRSRLIGIIYLENNLTKGAFTPTRLSVLQLLSGQAAISIENARLYQSLEDKVKQRTAQLAKANQEITALNELLKQENFRMRAELEVTKQLQQMILPKQSELESIAELEIAGFMEPADEVGGDYYDVL
ncbi:MAG TPA: GAF domain-containing protein, partial [Kamptonema sp.]|nr:GAF domain-containing protein [Kamptonema sp.]